MAQLDVYRLQDGGLVLDCQNDLLDDIGTRFVLPLMPPDYAPPAQRQLNPAVRIEGEELLVVTQLAMAIRTGELRQRVTSLAAHRDAIVHAIDVLIGAG